MVRTVQEPQNTPGRPRLSWGATTSLVRSPSSSQASKAGGTPMLSSNKTGSNSQASTLGRPRAVFGEMSENVPRHQRQTPSHHPSKTLKSSTTITIGSVRSPATTVDRAMPVTAASSSQMIQVPRTPLVGAPPIRRKFQTTPHPRFSLPNIEVDENQTMLMDMDLSDMARGSSGFDTESEADDFPVHRPTGRAVRGGVHMTPEPSQETPAAASSPPQSTPRAKQQPAQTQASARLPTPPSSQPGSFASPARLVASRTRPRPQDTPPRRTPAESSTPAAASDPSPNPRQKKSARLSEMPSISTLRKSVAPLDRVQVVLTPRALLSKSHSSKSTAKAGPGPSTLSQQLAHSPSASTPKASNSTRLPPATAPAASRKPRASQASAPQRLTASQKRSPPQTARAKPRASQVSPKTRRKSTGTRRTSLEGAKRGRKSVTPSALKGIKLGVGKKVVPAEPGEDPLLLVGWEADCSIWVPGNDEDEDEATDADDDNEGDMIPSELRRPVTATIRQPAALISQPASLPRSPPPEETEEERGVPLEPDVVVDEPQWGFQDDYGFGSDSDGDGADVGDDTFFHVAERRAETSQDVPTIPTPSLPLEETAELTEPVRPSTPPVRSTSPVASPTVRSTTPAGSPIIAARAMSPEPEVLVEQEEDQAEETSAVPAVESASKGDYEADRQSAELPADNAVPALKSRAAEEEAFSPVEPVNEQLGEAQLDESFTYEAARSVTHSGDEIIESVEEKQSVIERPSAELVPAVDDNEDAEDDWPETPEEPNMLDLLMSIPLSPPATMTPIVPSPPTDSIALPATPASSQPAQLLPSSPVVEALECSPIAPPIALDIATENDPRRDFVAAEDAATQIYPQIGRLAQSPLVRQLSFSDSESEEEATASCDVTAEAVSADWEVSIADVAAADDSFVEEDRTASTDDEENADYGVSVVSTEEEELVSAPLSPKYEEPVHTPASPEASHEQNELHGQRSPSQTLSPRAVARPRPSLFTLPGVIAATDGPKTEAVPGADPDVFPATEDSFEAPQPDPETLHYEPAPTEDISDRGVSGDTNEDDIVAHDQRDSAEDSDVEDENISSCGAEDDSAKRDSSVSPHTGVSDNADERTVDSEYQEKSLLDPVGDEREESVHDSFQEEEPIESVEQPVEPGAAAGSPEVEPQVVVDEAAEKVDEGRLDADKTLEEEASEDVSDEEGESASNVSRASSPMASEEGSEAASEEEESEEEQSVVLEPEKIILSVRMLGTVKVEPTEPEVPTTPTRHARALSAAITPTRIRTIEHTLASPARPSTPVYPRLDTLPIAQPENVSTTPAMTPPRRHARAADSPAESPSRLPAQVVRRPIADIDARTEQAAAVRPLVHKPSKLSQAIEMSPDTTAPASPVSDTHAESVSPTQGHPLTENSLRLLDSVQVVPAGRNLMEEMADAEPGDTSINSIIEVSSMDPRAAARAAAILKLNHAYIEHGVLPDRVNATPKRTPRRKSMHASSRFESIEAARGLSKDELLHEAELEIVSTHRGRSRSMSVFSTMTAATSMTELPIPGGWVRTPKRKRSRPVQADRADPSEDRLAAHEARAASSGSGSGSRPWGVPEWKKLEKVFRAEREAWIQEREVKGMPGGLIGWAKRVSIGPTRIVPWDPARAVDRFLREENAAELDGEWSRSVIELRVAALERRIKDKETSASSADEGGASPTKKARRAETGTLPATPRAAAPMQPNIEPPSTIKRMLGFFWGGGSTSASSTNAGSGSKAPVLPVIADGHRNSSIVTTQTKGRPSSHARPFAMNRPPRPVYSSTPTQAPRALPGQPARAPMLTSSFASTSMSSSTYSNTTLATPAANLYPRASEVSLSQRKAALQSLFSVRHPLSDSTFSTASIQPQVDEDRSFVRSRERGSFGSVKDVVRSFEEGRTLDKVMKGRSQAQAAARCQEPRLA